MSGCQSPLSGLFFGRPSGRGRTRRLMVAATSSLNQSPPNSTEQVCETSTAYSYVYDALNRLTQVQIGGGTNESYAYDAVGNLLTKTDASGAVQAYVYDAANQLKEIHQDTVTGPLLTRMSYDDNGNLMTKSDTVAGVLQLSYDPLDRLVQASKPGAVSENYLYDDQGRRIEKTVGG